MTAVNGRPVILTTEGDPVTVEEFVYQVQYQEVPYFLYENTIVEDLGEADCRFAVVLTNVLQINYGILWSKFATQEMKEKMDLAIIEAFDNKSQDVRIAEGVANASAQAQKCMATRTAGNQQIQIADLYGLWIKSCLCLGLAIIVKLVSLVKCPNGKRLVDLYDLAMRRPREQLLIGAMNAQTTCIAMVSKEMIRRIRLQGVATYNECFNLLGVPLRQRKALLFMIENDPEFQQFMNPIIEHTKEPPKPIFDAVLERFFHLKIFGFKRQSAGNGSITNLDNKPGSRKGSRTPSPSDRNKCPRTTPHRGSPKPVSVN